MGSKLLNLLPFRSYGQKMAILAIFGGFRIVIPDTFHPFPHNFHGTAAQASFYVAGWSVLKIFAGCLGRLGADQEDLVIRIAIWMLYKLCCPLTSDEFRVISIGRGTSFVLQSFRGRIGLPKRAPKLSKSRFFGCLFLLCFLYRCWYVFSSKFG